MRRIAALVFAALLAPPAMAQEAFPNKPITLVVPYAPGGGSDFLGRVLADGLRAQLKESVVVQNLAGAGSVVGSAHVAKAKPDGYTLLQGTGSTHGANSIVYKKLPYDPIKDFAPVTLITSVPNVLVVHPSLPVKTVKDLIALAKARPGQLNFASGSTGSAGHLAGELLVEHRPVLRAIVQLELRRPMETLVGHLGRPDGESWARVVDWSEAPVAAL